MNGKTYKSQGQAKLWDLLYSRGIAKNPRMKQKNSSLTWYGVSVYGNGESYYYEGSGKIGTLASAKKYNWSDLNTPIS